MNAIEPLVDEAREHLITRAKREGLVTVGYDVMDSPLGPLWIAVGPRRVLTELDQYFAHRRRSFDLDVDLTPLTPFQRRVLAATALVPYGELTTYRQVARRAGNEQASRAAGGAIGSNPIPIVVPCHRVVASDGSLGGYAGGLPAKRRLLALELGEALVPKGGWPPARGALELSRRAHAVRRTGKS